MAQILEDPRNLAYSVGKGVGSGLSSGLQQLATQKLERMNRKHQYEERVQGLKALRIPDAEQLAHLDDHSLQALIKAKIEEPSNQQFASSLSALLGNEQPLVEQPQIQPQQQAQSISDKSFTPEVVQQLGSYLKSPEALQQFSPEQLQQVEQRLQGFNKPTAAQLQQTSQNPLIAPGLNKRDALELAKIGIQNKKEEKALEHKEKQLTQKEQSQINKDTGLYYKEILDQEKTAKKLDTDTNRMLKIIEKGNIPNPAFYKILKNIEEQVTPAVGAGAGAAIGGAIGAAGGPVALPAAASGAALGAGIGAVIQPLATLLRWLEKSYYPDTEEFEKLSASMISGAKAIFGSRITDRDLITFLETLPTLSQTDAGKRAVIRNMQLANKASEVRARNMREIIEENGGKRPTDLQNLVEKRSSDELDKLAKEFVG